MLNQFKMWIPVILAIGWTVYLNDWSKQITYKLMTGDLAGAYELYEGIEDEKKHEELSNNSEKLFTPAELAKYDNLENGLYLSILGQVFDVTKGEQYYAKGATYHAFTGRDASMAFVTGDFTDTGLIDDTTSLTHTQAKSMANWLNTYHEKYIYKGKLIGRYYDQSGHATQFLEAFNAKVHNADQEKSVIDESNRIYPPCNVRWSPEEGTRVWCTNQSGGISRDWIGVPRLYYENTSGKERCACVRLDSPEYLDSKGSFKEYQNCPINSAECGITT